MQNPRIASFVFFVAAVAGAGCVAPIGVREDLHPSQPLGETALFRSESVRMEAPPEPPASAPRYGLAALEKQVLGATPTGPDLAMLRAGPAAPVFAADDEDPLPAELASLAATRFAVEAAGAACRGRPLPGRTLSDRAMEQFGRTVLAVTRRAYQDPKLLDIDRLNRIAAFVETGEISLGWPRLVLLHGARPGSLRGPHRRKPLEATDRPDDPGRNHPLGHHPRPRGDLRLCASLLRAAQPDRPRAASSFVL